MKNYSRTNPYHARIKERSLLSGPSSSKKTYHIVLEIESGALPYKVGDSIGVLPQNDPEEVHAILQTIGCSGAETLFHPRENVAVALRDFLLTKANISRVNIPFFKILCEQKCAEDKTKLHEFLHRYTLHELLLQYPLIDFSHFAKLMPLLPRFYSIANSARVFPNEIHLTVAYVNFIQNGQRRKGVGSFFLCTLAQESTTKIPIYLQPSNHFTLPDDPNASIIFVGPGTGIAPFRAFLQERLALAAPGRNWLFFGDRNRVSDFYYGPFWLELQSQGLLRLNLAFSRDASIKIYVQHKMYEEKSSLWSWLEEGAYFYVCGDAEEMAKDVDSMLHQIIREEGRMEEENARQYIKHLRSEKRYLTDVY
ncbi:MAG TPA: hypothetical protein VLE95_08790 [Chlamydiales bacterium]|nr:hypothetical protein [Chlamydiales bacterium]